MIQRANQQFRVPIGSAFPLAVMAINYRTMLPFIQSDVSSITESIRDTETGTIETRTLTVGQVLFDTLQESAEIGESGYEYNVLVIVPSDRIIAKRTYRYQLTIVPKDGSGEAEPDWAQKTDEIDVVGD